MDQVPNTLADALLDDLDDITDAEEEDEDDDDDDDEIVENNEVRDVGKSSNEESHLTDVFGAAESSFRGGTHNPQSSLIGARTRKPLLQDSHLLKHLNAIRKHESAKTSSLPQKEQEEEEYQLIVESNKQLARLGDELVRAHGELCTTYHAKFPELEELIPSPVQYLNAVRVIGNEMDLSKVNDALNQFLSSNQILTISVSGSTTSGRPLTRDELNLVDQAAAYMEQILKVQTELMQFVERRMEGLAPNVCALIGSSTAAKLLGLAGGLEELSKIPACNLQVLGQIRQSAASRGGLSSATTRPNEGILVECDLVQSLPKNLQKKALKTVAAKVALAARCDFVNVSAGRPRDSSSGLAFRHEIEQKFEKWQEPDKAPVLKALPNWTVGRRSRRP